MGWSTYFDAGALGLIAGARWGVSLGLTLDTEMELRAKKELGVFMLEA